MNPSELHLDDYIAHVKQECLPAIWSKGVTLSREASFACDRYTPEEIIVRIITPGVTISPKVTLWPADEDQLCNCGSKQDPCHHVAGVLIALKQGLIKSTDNETKAAKIKYVFTENPRDGLVLERFLVSEGTEKKFHDSLLNHSIVATRDDYAVESLGFGVIPKSNLKNILKVLEGCFGIFFEGNEIRTSGKPLNAESRRIVAKIAVLENGTLSPLESAVAATESKTVIDVSPRIELKLEKFENGDLAVTPVMFYGDPPVGRVSQNGKIELFKTGILIHRKHDEENAQLKELQNTLHLKIDQITRYRGSDAIAFTKKSMGWKKSGSEEKSFKNLDTHLALQDLAGAEIPIEWTDKNLQFVEMLLSETKTNPESLKKILPLLSRPSMLDHLKNELANSSTITDAELPSDLAATLRPYQKEGVNWLAFLKNMKLGAMLADDMGLGKTLQVLSTLEKSKRTLVVTPTSVLYSWLSQIKTFRPTLSVSLFHGASRTFDEKCDIILTSYALLRLNLELFKKEKWNVIVLDESQTIKNRENQTTRACLELEGEFKIALTGTPVENRLTDLYSQFDFLNPGLLGSFEDFKDKPAAEVRRKIRPFLLRRLKNLVAKDLPSKTESLLVCEQSEEERQAYAALLAVTKTDILNKLGAGDSVFHVLELLLRLRQSCCDLKLLPGSSNFQDQRSSKTQELVERLQTVTEEGHKALVFSQFTSYLDRIESALREEGIEYLRLDGSTTNRDAVVTKFQSDEGPKVLLMSLKAGGVGLTLTRADHVFIVDPWWNPAAENQAIDRTHRIGQTNPVFVYRLVMKNTIEEKILELQAKKKELSESVIGDETDLEFSKAFTKEDLLSLFN